MGQSRVEIAAVAAAHSGVIEAYMAARAGTLVQVGMQAS